MALADKRILLVDDSKVIRMTLQKALQKSGIRPDAVAEAEDGNEALERFQSFRPHIVFLDVMMPGKDGEETGRAMLEAEPDTKIVFLTGVSRDDERVRRMISEGLFDFIEKPVRVEAVRKVLETIEKEEVGYGRIK